MTQAACPDPRALDDFASGRLSLAQRSSIEVHLDGCAECARTIAELARLYGSRSVGATSAPRLHPSSRPPAPASAAERYAIGGKLGEGGMGAVFVAHDRELDRRVALKLLHPDASSDTEQQRVRLMAEAQAMARLAHPNVVTVYDVGRLGDHLFVAMELVEGMTLREHLAAAARPRAAIIDAFVQAGRGLAAAHHVGLVHRDFKPDNVLVGKDGRARVTDFGLSKPMAIPWSQVAVDATAPTRPLAMTVPGMLVGTPAYMAPEQLRGELADARADQFAYGIALFEALFGARPFEGETLRELAANVTAGRMRSFPRNAPRWLRALLQRALAPRPADRFASMDALLAALSKDHGRVRRLGLSVGAMLAGAGAIVAVLHFATAGERTNTAPPALGSSASSAQAPPAGPMAGALCGSAADAIDAVWTQERRSALGDKEAGKHLVARIDERVTAWKSVKQKRCASGPSDPSFEACMTAAERELDAMLGLVPPADGAVVARALETSFRLPDAVRCDQADVATLYPVAPVDGAARASIAMADASRVVAAVALGRRFEVDPLVKSLAADVATLADPPSKAYVHWALGLRDVAFREYEPAIKHLTEAAELARTSHDVLTEARSATALGELYGITLLDPPNAEKWLRVAEDATKGSSALAHFYADVLAVRARVMLEWENPLKAKEALERAIPIAAKADGKDPFVARMRAQYTRTLVALEAWPEAISAGEVAVRASVEAVGEIHPTTAAAYVVLAEANVAELKLDAAEKALQKAEASQAGILGGESVEDALRFDAKGKMLEYGRDLDGAQKAYELGLRKRQASIVSDHPDTALSYAHLADLEALRGKNKEAVERRKEALGVLERFYGEKDPHLWRPLIELAAEREIGGDSDGAANELKRAAELVRARFDDSSPVFGRVLHRNGLLLAHLGRWKEAIVDLEGAYMALDDAYDFRQPFLAFMTVARGEVYAKAGDKVTARRMVETGLDSLRERLGEDHPDVKDIARRVAAIQ